MQGDDGYAVRSEGARRRRGTGLVWRFAVNLRRDHVHGGFQYGGKADEEERMIPRSSNGPIRRRADKLLPAVRREGEACCSSRVGVELRESSRVGS